MNNILTEKEIHTTTPNIIMSSNPTKRNIIMDKDPTDKTTINLNTSVDRKFFVNNIIRNIIMGKKNNKNKNIKNDNVNHPQHYTSHPSGIECIDITRHYCFDIGNAIKYLWRAGLKTEEGISDKNKEIEDLQKANWYITDRINQLKKEL